MDSWKYVAEWFGERFTASVCMAFTQFLTKKNRMRFSSVLPMKIENRLLIGRDFFADWLSVAFNFLPNQEIFSRGLSAAARLFDYKTTMRRGPGSSHSAHIHFHPRTR